MQTDDIGTNEQVDFLQETPWPPAGCPPLAWPALDDAAERLAWYEAVIGAYAALWGDHATAPRLAPMPVVTLDALEQALGHALPPALRAYHAQLGALSLGETLRRADPTHDAPIQPLASAWPSLEDIGLTPDDLALASHLVAFGDYLGNGNHFCYDTRDGAVWYFDHDGPRFLTRFFDGVVEYLDALMLLTLAEVHEDDAAGEALLRQRHGDACIRTWRY